MDRRAFIGTLTGALLAAPLAVEGQQAGKVCRIEEGAGLLRQAGEPHAKADSDRPELREMKQQLTSST
jgi:hypothetical protein